MDVEFYTFFTAERLNEFWHYVKWFLFLAAPLIMIVFAGQTLEYFVDVIRKTLGITNDEEDDDDDYEFKRY